MENLVFFGGLIATAVPLTAAFALIHEQGYPAGRKAVVVVILCLEATVGIAISFAVVHEGHEKAMKKMTECTTCPDYLWTEQ
jgi:hypothetical protein